MISISGATAQQAIYLRDIKKLKIPLPSLSEQQAIVTEIEMRLSVCDKVEQDIAENLEKAEVRMAEDWEPAEVLLERVKDEKAIAGKR